ncbi:IS200/IS605 family transposase [Desulfobotulus sp. H1]|uniref:IS200/IS605 family transposase n=1 Tax=Desulfobotulus pelophilus TaxID=2823377 RepID=A0ABT3NAJ1_9BACT|nr:IS200/IS605 family transposase [Desulfobotulus pelophilus]MCW7754186.1 IS200/IS605 family transposase [Desulfobotulus pelophilus]
MYDDQSLSHTRWDCTCLETQYRKQKIYGSIWHYLRKILHDLAGQKQCRVLEEHLHSDHVHMLLSIPPQYPVSQVLGFLKSKSAIQMAQNFQGRKQNFIGKYFWARDYYVSTLSKDENIVREYTRNQKREDKRLDQLNLFG